MAESLSQGVLGREEPEYSSEKKKLHGKDQYSLLKHVLEENIVCVYMYPVEMNVNMGCCQKMFENHCTRQSYLECLD